MTTTSNDTIARTGSCTSPREITIESDGVTLAIEPPELTAVIKVDTRHLHPATDAAGTQIICTERQSLLWPGMRHRNAGLLQVAVAAAQRAGFTVHARRLGFHREALSSPRTENSGSIGPIAI